MLLRVIKEPPTRPSYGRWEADRARVGIPATKDAGQAEACLTRPAINARENNRHKKSACSRLWRYRALRENGFLHPVTGFTVTGRTVAQG